MRRARDFSLAFLVLSLTGCLNDRPARSTSLIDRVRGIGGPSGPDAVFIEYTIIERPAGNAEMNRGIWKQIDELALPSETRALLGENGFRCGVIGGLLPSELETLIQNPRSAIGSRQRRLYVNNPAVITLSGPNALAEYQVRPTLEGTETTAHFENAKFAMNFVPVHGTDGRTKLKCVPEVEFTDKKHWTPTGATGEGWANNKPLERYQGLAFEVNLSPREFLVIGADFNRGNWLGNRMFNDTTAGEKVQRLLVIRTGRLAAADLDLTARNLSKDGVVPLALQAKNSAARGVGP